ncbi:hypothetical protein LINPERHAP1_LOCUS3769, partial [Linum perenne]
RGGQTKVIKIKFKDHRRATSDGNKILFNLDNLGVQPGGPLASFIGKYVGECARIWTYYPIYPPSWKHVPDATKTRAFQQFFLGKFYCDSDLLPAARKYWDHAISRLWGKARLDAWRAKVKYAKDNNLPYEWVRQNPPQGCPESDWLAYM